MSNIYFIINPVAKNGGSIRIWEKATEILKSKNTVYQFFFTEYSGHATELAAKIVQEQSDACIIGVGGDGTIHEIVAGMIGYPKAKLAYLPAGSGNDFARGVGIPRNVTEALEVIYSTEPYVKQIDIGSFQQNGQTGYFVNSIGMGVDALVTDSVEKSKLKSKLNRVGLGKLVYLYFFVKSLLTYKCVELKMEVDGQRYDFRDVWIVNVANHCYFGGGIKISPNALMDDGVFHILVVHSYSRLKLLVMFFTIIWGGHVKLKNVNSYTGKSIKLISPQEVFIQTDGENIGRSQVDVTLLPLALSVHCLPK